MSLDMFTQQVQALRAFQSAMQGVGAYPIHISFDDGYESFVDTAWPILQDTTLPVTMFVLPGLVGGSARWLDGDPPSLLGWPQLQALSAEGLGIGSHLMTHTHLGKMSLKILSAEAIRSKLSLEDALGLAVDKVAVPYGYCTPDQARLLRDVGYKEVHIVDGPWFRQTQYPDGVIARQEMRGDIPFEGRFQILRRNLYHECRSDSRP
ncbi:polysaccharide deacetylase family protein [Rhodovulum sulfidophilum]|uniref:Chitooligosaccharide deacetylase n=2 Tax=Rhodovulum sulfidophilum TaxID=35806 RepID=A0ABS1S077_RHOSU|nr:polysaccharide deacetylase family protein [Rhodovulum sulfidophilum]